MFQTVMFIALGFLCASLIGLFIAPPLWRHAVRLTTKRIQSQSPLTMAEIQADRDQLKAEFALSTRKLELTVEELKERNGRHVVENSRLANRIEELTEKAKDHAAQLVERDAKIMKLTSRSSPLEDDVRSKTEMIQQQAEKIRQQGEVIERQRRMLKEQTELAAGREAEVNALRRKAREDNAEERTLGLAHQAIADRVNELGRLAANIESRRAELYETRRDISSLRETIAEEASSDSRRVRAYRRTVTKLLDDRDTLMDELRKAEDESGRLREEIQALETTWKSRSNPYDDLKREVDAVARDVGRVLKRLPEEVDADELDVDLAARAPEQKNNVTPINANSSRRNSARADGDADVDGQTDRDDTDDEAGESGTPPSLADRIRALQNELSKG